jgi:hypothetical protein
MPQKQADNWFNDINYVSILDTVKGIMTSDGSMSVLLDFERVLDECDLYAYKNWINGELVSGPKVGRYDVSCIFMWPYKLMPDPQAVNRLIAIGCKVDFEKTKIKVPVKVENYDDFIQGTMYPKAAKRQIWLVKITVPIELMDDIKEGSITLAGSTIDLEEIDAAYDEDLDKQGIDQEGQQPSQEMSMPGLSGPQMPGSPGSPGL